jgi:hypothetical protein
MEVFMKKILLAGLIFSAASFSSHGLGFYFDAGIGFGPAWTELNGKDWVKIVTGQGTPDEFALDLGLKIGAGPFSSMPVYIAGVLGGMGHKISDSHDNYYQIDSYLLGPSILFYPMPFLQIAASLGFSFVSVDTSFSENWPDSETGFAWDISVAYDAGLAGKHGVLLGLKFFSAANTLENSGDDINSSMLSIFVRYAFHQRN